ncbi:C2H2-type zinc finger-containing protein [Cavenderia fasciculata]|uniref:C2H2-type zinc finger-containing protein n=1 Tax=Cavenderia fasciculata TaxID=261658 RepID=F4QDA4_CACFS|nr:C2H2-type zinc finger-containing protein [Cavenderia fasciculata]EGG13732.1 C2H2-type zinc finger-containing protein [Cavenderia fasciculata]|eukprot:XP_004350436.1 C2H2-type zinc finger-containing protein [Cavenderia fasciculata]
MADNTTNPPTTDTTTTTTSQDAVYWAPLKPLTTPLVFQLADTRPTVCAVKFPCLLCEHVEYESRPTLEHLLVEHKLVIADVNSVANLSSYLFHWRSLMKDKPIAHYTTTIHTQQTPSAPPTNYYLLSDVLQEDQALRRKLQTERLSFVLDQQHRERTDPSFSSSCPMCLEEFKGDRSAVSSHLFEQHSFNIGLPDNLVNINELLDLLKEKYDICQCLYCEKIFKSQAVLKQHMKKKKHVRLNPHNTEYDRFYLLNYLEPGKNWEEIKKEKDVEDEDEKDDILSQDTDGESNVDNTVDENDKVAQWEDWEENSDDEPDHQIVCLYCPNQYDTQDDILNHMIKTHKFDLFKVRKDQNYYDSIKLINFIRRQSYELNCPMCGLKHQDEADLNKHIQSNDHVGVDKNNEMWRDAQFLFPTYENDSLLRSFEDFEDQAYEQEWQEDENKYQEEMMEELKFERELVLERLTKANVQLPI